MKLKGPWTVRRCTTFQWMDQVLDTSVIGAELSFLFTGRGLILGFDFGKASAEFDYCLDDGKWTRKNEDCPEWCGDEGWYRVTLIGDDLTKIEHKFELKVMRGNKATNFRLAMIGIVP